MRMTHTDFTTVITVDRSPNEVFNAINHVEGWWSEEVEGITDRLHGEFRYRYRDVHQCSMKIIEFDPGRRVVWLVTGNHFSFTADKTEWVGTLVSFDIKEIGQGTELRFTHKGLVPEYECFNICRDAWTHYIHDSLRGLIENGKGEPNPKEGGFNEWLLEQYEGKAS
jgi:uncharacterized protein YndB with AHSA1/START domain